MSHLVYFLVSYLLFASSLSALAIRRQRGDTAGRDGTVLHSDRSAQGESGRFEENSAPRPPDISSSTPGWSMSPDLYSSGAGAPRFASWSSLPTSADVRIHDFPASLSRSPVVAPAEFNDTAPANVVPAASLGGLGARDVFSVPAVSSVRLGVSLPKEQDDQQAARKWGDSLAPPPGSLHYAAPTPETGGRIRQGESSVPAVTPEVRSVPPFSTDGASRRVVDGVWSGSSVLPPVSENGLGTGIPGAWSPESPSLSVSPLAAHLPVASQVPFVTPERLSLPHTPPQPTAVRPHGQAEGATQVAVPAGLTLAGDQLGGLTSSTPSETGGAWGTAPSSLAAGQKGSTGATGPASVQGGTNNLSAVPYTDVPDVLGRPRPTYLALSPEAGLRLATAPETDSRTREETSAVTRVRAVPDQNTPERQEGAGFVDHAPEAAPGALLLKHDKEGSPTGAAASAVVSNTTDEASGDTAVKSHQDNTQEVAPVSGLHGQLVWIRVCCPAAGCPAAVARVFWRTLVS